MIERFQEIKNVGTYKHAEQVAKCGFNKTTIIYGNNSQGKSTFCDILKSLALNDPSYIENRKSIDGTSSPQVEISFGNKIFAKFVNGAWSTHKDLRKSQPIIIFDTEFIQNNVFTNSEIERKNKENFTDFILGSDSIKIQKQLIELKDENNSIDKDNSILKKDIENYTQLPLDEFAKIDYIEDIKEIDTHCLALNQQLFNLQNDKKDTDNIKKLPLPTELKFTDNSELQYKEINKILDSSYAFTKSNIIDSFNKHKQIFDANRINIDKWISDGYSIADKDICPYCGSTTSNNQLVESYITLFCENFINYTNDVESLNKYFFENKSYESIRNQINENIVKLKNLASKIYIDGVNEKISLLECKSVTLLNSVDNLVKKKQTIENLVQEKIKIKKSNKYDKVGVVEIDNYSNNLELLKHQIDEYNELLGEFVLISSDYLANLSVDKIALQIKELEKEYKEKTNIVNRNIYNEKYLLYLSKLKKIKENEEKSKRLKIDFETTQTDFINTFFKDIDMYFTRLGSRNYQIEQETTKLGIKKIFTLSLKYRGTKISNLRFVLSDSDKRALALSIFLSKLKNDKSLSKAIIVMDDPITSFDNERMTLFINILKEFKDAEQIIILTHYSEFYKKLVELMYAQKPAPALIKIQYLPNTNKLITVDKNNDTLLMNDFEQALYNMYSFIEGSTHSYSSNDARTMMQKYLEYKFYYDIKSMNINTVKFESFLDELKSSKLITDNQYNRLNQKREEYNVNSHVFDNDSEESKRNSIIDLQNILKEI